jgi:uncharacterized DUF497 family protein
MLFEWDETKNRANRAKHGVTFEQAARVFHDPFHLTRHDRVENGEVRWQTIGRIGDVTIVIVAHAIRTDLDVEIYRLISARRATKRERRSYEEGDDAL